MLDREKKRSNFLSQNLEGERISDFLGRIGGTNKLKFVALNDKKCSETKMVKKLYTHE